MALLRGFIHSLLLFQAFAAHAFKNLTPKEQAVLPPTRDPFYTAPEGFADAKPGVILRVRVAPGNLTTVTGNASEAYNILYRTTDSNYKPTWAVTTLFVPCKSPHNSSALADQLLTYLVAYDSTDVNASPSFALYSSPQSEISDTLGRGWYVNVPDYEGPLASYSAGVISGHATLDSVRAANAVAIGLGLSSNARSAMWGYSGGALAGEWAAELQVQYAPELDFVGAAFGGTTPNTTNVLLSVDGSFYAGLIPNGYIGLATQHPAFGTFLQSHLKRKGPYNATSFNSAANMTFDEAIEAFANQTITKYFTNGAEFIFTPEFLYFSDRDGQMGYHGVPQMPMYAYKAIHDEVSPVSDTDTLVDRYCTVGADIWYQRNTIGGHIAEETNGMPAAIEFLEKVLSGTYKRTGCLTETITVNISDNPL